MTYRRATLDTLLTTYGTGSSSSWNGAGPDRHDDSSHANASSHASPSQIAGQSAPSVDGHNTRVAPRCPGLTRRIAGVFLSPTATFLALASTPRWFGALAIALALTMGSTYSFMRSDIGAQAMTDRRVARLQSAGRSVSPDLYAELIVRQQNGAAFTTVVSGLWLLVFTTTLAGATWLTLNAASIATPAADATPAPGAAAAAARAAQGSHRRFVQVFAVATHAAVLSATGVACVYLLNYLRGSVEPATSAYILMPFLPSHGLWAHLAALLDLFDLWWLVVYALGLSALYHRRLRGLVLTGIGLYLLATIARAAVKVLAGAPV